MRKILILLLFVLSTVCSAGESREYPLKFKQECYLLPTLGMVNISSVIKLKGSKSEKFFAVSCWAKGFCSGAELRLEDKIIGPVSMLPVKYDVLKSSISNTASTFSIVLNTTITIDASSKTVKNGDYFSGSCSSVSGRVGRVLPYPVE